MFSHMLPVIRCNYVRRFLGDGGEVEAECIGNWYNAGQGKGLEIPVDYRLVGNRRYLERLVSRLSKKEFVGNLNISYIRKCQSLIDYNLYL